jgi:hypothetical protein
MDPVHRKDERDGFDVLGQVLGELVEVVGRIFSVRARIP